MKKIVPVLLLVLIAGKGLAQNPGLFLSVNGGATVNFWKPGLFNDFVNSYNNDPSLKPLFEKTMDEFSGTMTGFSRGFGINWETRGSNIGMEFNKCVFTQSRAAFLNTNVGREIKLRFVTWNFQFDFNKKFGRHVEAGITFGISMRDGYVYSYRLYGNESNRSLGPELPLNGIYRGMLESDANLGLNLRFNFLKYFAFQVRAYKAFQWNKATPESLDKFQDLQPGKNPYAEYFPHDYTQYNTNVQGGVFDADENIIPNHFPGWYLQTSFIIKFNVARQK